MILAALGKSFEECVEIGPDRPGKDSAYTLDSVKIRTALGWQDRITLEEGIEDVIRWAQRFAPPSPIYRSATSTSLDAAGRVGTGNRDLG